MDEFYHILPYEEKTIYFTVYGIHLLMSQI